MKNHYSETVREPMFSESVINQVSDAVRMLWQDYDQLSRFYQSYSLGNRHPNSVLKSADDFEKLLQMSYEKKKKNIFGIGGNGHVTPTQQVERFRWRICIGFYRYLNSNIPIEVEEKIEKLCQMDAEDAKYWSEVYETAQWNLYSAPKGQQPTKERINTKRIATVLFVAAWILFWFYIFLFGKGIVNGAGRFFESPSFMFTVGCLAIGFLAFAQAIKSEEGNGIVVFLVVASIIFSIIFCGATYNPGGFFQKTFWVVCLPCIIKAVIFIIVGRIIGNIARKAGGKR